MKIINILMALMALCPAICAQNMPQPDSLLTDSALMQLMRAQLDAAQLVQDSLRHEIEHLIVAANSADSLRRERIRARIDSMRATSTGALVIVEGDTLFALYAKHGALTAARRAELAANEIERLSKSFTLEPDSVYVSESEQETDLMYDGSIILSLTDLDGLWAGMPRDKLVDLRRQTIIDELKVLHERHGLWQLVRRGTAFLALLVIMLTLLKLINVGYRRLLVMVAALEGTRLKPFCVQNVELLDTKRQLALLVWAVRIVRYVLILVVLLVMVPLMFSIFPQTKDLAHRIVGYIWAPIYDIIKQVVEYIPNLFTIIVIIVVVRSVVKVLRYLAGQIEVGHIKLNGFFPDWALPTFYIIRFLLYAFMVAMIYPYLPGSNSGVFQGISVFVGLIVSLGSSSVIGNIIAGLVITYMRPFKMGDRIEIHGITGDVIEKTPFVTRIRTPKNEMVTIPNSFVMSSQTVNYSLSAQQFGLIVHVDVGICYGTPWREVYSLLIDAALATPGVVDDPRPFVLQTNLADSYPIYQLNAYIRDASRLPDIYSDLNQNIQDRCDQAGIQLLTPTFVKKMGHDQ